MRCTHCGANIPDDQLICPVCGAEVQIVPDYNPLEDVLAREVKGSVAGATRQIQADVVRRQNMSQNQQNRNRQNQRSNPNSTRVLSQAELDKVREERSYGARERKDNVRKQMQSVIRMPVSQQRICAGHLLKADACSRSKNKKLPEKNAKNYLRFFSCSFFWLVSEFISDIRIPIQA